MRRDSQSQWGAGGQRNEPAERQQKNAERKKCESVGAFERPLAGREWSNQGRAGSRRNDSEAIEGSKGRGKKKSGLAERPFVGFERVQSLAPCQRLVRSRFTKQHVEGA